MTNGFFGRNAPMITGLGLGLLSGATPQQGLARGATLGVQMQRNQLRDQIDRERLALAQQQLAQAGQITPFQQAQLDLQQQRLDRTPAPLTFDQRMQLAQAGRAPRETAEQRAEATQRVKQRGERAALRRGGQQVLGALNQLRSRVGRTGPGATRQEIKAADRFTSATGPLEGSGVGQFFGELSPFRSTQNVTTLRQVQQDAQAINTLMQRALLKGGGSITENERAQINEILGSIATARDSNSAQALLNNFEGLVRNIFDMGETSGAVQQAGSTGVINFSDLPE